MKNILKLVLFSGVFAFFATSNNTTVEAQVPGSYTCPGVRLHCLQIGDVNYIGRLNFVPIKQSIE